MTSIAICHFANQRAVRATLNSPKEVTQLVVVNPDEIDINGNLAIVKGRVQSSGQLETMMVRLDSKSQQRQLSQLTEQTIWRVCGELRPIVPATNFNQFDSRAYQRSKGIFNELNVDDWKLSKVDNNEFGFSRYCHELRARSHRYFSKMPQPLGGYCQRLLIGENDRQTQSLMNDVKKLGIIHLFCISGMHVVLLVSILRRVLVYSHLEKRTIDLALICCLPAYLIIGGGAASLIRAVVMAEAGLIGRRLALSGLDIWSVGLLVGFAIDPYVLLSLGGQLSYLLSFMLQVLPKGLNSWQEAALMNLCGLPSLLSFVYEFHVLSFISSYLMIPIFSVAIFPAVIISAFTYPFFPEIGNLVNGLLTILHQFLGSAALMPGMVHFGKPAPPIALILFLAILWSVANPANRKNWHITAGLFLIVFLIIHFPLSGEVTFVDIGQGDCIIVRAPLSRSTVMIDTGGKLNFADQGWQRRQVTSDVAERSSINYLKSIGVSHLDAVCLSHHDTDHIGYIPTVLRELKVDNVLVPAGMEKQARFTRLIQQPSSLKNPTVIPVTDGYQMSKIGLRVLHPFKSGAAENTDSMVLSGRFGNQSFIFTGDLDQAGEHRLIRRYPNLHVDVLKLGHHGSKTASSTAFLKQLKPRLGIISAGRFNRYGHPNNATMHRLKRAHVTPVSTQQYGMIRYRYWTGREKWETKLRGDELKWMLPPYDNS